MGEKCRTKIEISKQYLYRIVREIRQSIEQTISVAVIVVVKTK